MDLVFDGLDGGIADMTEDALRRTSSNSIVGNESIPLAAWQDRIAREVEGLIEMGILLDHHHSVASRKRFT